MNNYHETSTNYNQDNFLPHINIEILEKWCDGVFFAQVKHNGPTLAHGIIPPDYCIRLNSQYDRQAAAQLDYRQGQSLTSYQEAQNLCNQINQLASKLQSADKKAKK